MNNFCIIVNDEKDQKNQTAASIIRFLEGQHKNVVLTTQSSLEERKHGTYTNAEEIPADTECAIVLGGDGTIIQAAKDLLHRDIPILGVNLGTVGYLAEIEKQNIEAALSKLFRDQFKIEERLMLYGMIHKGEETELDVHALNDIVISRSGQCKLIVVNLYINDALIDTYVADGLIVSTPTGSTGYNLSAGGPVMKPGIDALVITPICPHSLNKRSLVVSADDKICLEVGQRKEISNDEAIAVFDGREEMQLISGERIFITRAKEITKIVKLTENSYFDILKNKLGREKV